MLKRLSALNEIYKAGLFGSDSPERVGIRMQQRLNLAMVQVKAFPEDAEEVAKRLGKSLGLTPAQAPQAAVSDEKLTILWAAPEQWLVIEEGGRQGLDQALREALSEFDAVAVTDLSHARLAVRIEGPKARDLLSKFTSIDLHPEVFKPGHSTPTKFGHFMGLLHCHGPQAFDLYVYRSFGQALWEELCENAAEYGYQVI